MSQALRPCFCTSYKCNGKRIRPCDSTRHARLDEEKRRDIAQDDTLVKQVFRMALNGSTSTPDSKLGDAIWERHSHNPAQGFGASSDALLTFTGSVSNRDPPSSASAVPESPSRSRAMYDLLLAMDREIELHVDAVAAITAKPLLTTSADPLKPEEQWFRDTFHNIHIANPAGDEATRLLREAMIDRVMNQLSLIEAERRRRGHVASANTPNNVFNTGGRLAPHVQYILANIPTCR